MYKNRYSEYKNKLLEDNSIDNYNKKIFKKFFEWEERKLKNHNGVGKLDEASYKTLYGYCGKLKKVNDWFKNKAWNKLSIQDIKKVHENLCDGKILNNRGKPLEDRRGYYVKIFFNKPFELAGLKEKVGKAIEFKPRDKIKEIGFCNFETFKNLIETRKEPRHRALLWLAFDIGENINSLLQLRKCDFRKQFNRETKQEGYLVYLPNNILKRSRKTRSEPTIHSETKRILDIVLQNLKDGDLLFPFSQRMSLKILHSARKKCNALCEPNNKPVTWESIRKGMACYLFEIGWSPTDINRRMGHSPMSRQLDVYVDYLAVNRKRAIQKHHNVVMEDLHEELKRLKQVEQYHAMKLREMDYLRDSLNVAKRQSRKYSPGSRMLEKFYENPEIVLEDKEDIKKQVVKEIKNEMEENMKKFMKSPKRVIEIK